MAMKRLILSLRLSIGLALPAAAKYSFEDGNDLLEMCESTELHNQGSCIGFVLGVSAVPMFQGNLCVPGTVSYGQAKDVVTVYLRQHPEVRHLPGALLVLEALGRMFPCVKQ